MRFIGTRAWKFSWLGAGLLAAMLGVGGCSSDGDKQRDLIGGASTASPPEFEWDDKLEVGETIHITLSGPEGIDKAPIQQRIKDDGTINLPFIGSVKAAERKVAEVQKDIHDLYVPKYYKYLNVVIQYEDRFYFVGGQVRNPSRQQYYGSITVLKAIDSAGGFTDFADRRKVAVTRANGKVLKVDCKKALTNPKLDIPIYPRDKIEVPMRWM